MSKKISEVKPCDIPKEVQKKVEKQNNVTEIVFILDKSGSMDGLEDDTIGGFNAMIEKQKQEEGKAYLSTILFANSSTVLHDRITLNEVQPLTKKDYVVGGCTALLDAIGDAVKHIKNVHKYARKEDVPSKTIFVITTDGMENASRKYSSDEVKELIKEQEEKGWVFLFLADNIDAVQTAKDIGIPEEYAVNYNTREDTGVMYCMMSAPLSDYRRKGVIDEDWADVIDSKKRSAKKDKNKK